MISFKSNNNELNKEFGSYFDMAVNIWKYDNSKNEYLSEQKSMGEQCTPQHYLDGAKTYYEDFELDQAICLKKDMTVELLETGKIQQ